MDLPHLPDADANPAPTPPLQFESAGFGQVVQAVDRIGANHGDPAAIALYRVWIAANAGGVQMLHGAWFNLGAELSRAGATADAMLAYRSAPALKPDFHPAAINLGLLLEQSGQQEAALHTWGQAIQPDAARTALINQRARLLEQTGRLEQAEHALRTSLLTDPAQPDAVQHWLHIRQKMCEWPVLTDMIPGLTRHDLLMQCGPLAALALTDRVAEQHAICANWLRRKTAPSPERLSPARGYRHKRIRLGYMSSDFCRHAMSYLIAELFERHDRDRFEVFGYCTSLNDGSEIRHRIIGAFDHFTSIRALSDEAAARCIREDEIDILIDLNGLTAGSRLQILRWRPAPIQATYLGFIGPVPLPELDYLFCDSIVIPPSAAGLYAPVPLYIADIYQANDSKRSTGAPTTRAQAGLPEDRFIFGCFSNHYKITEEMFAAWLQILTRVETAVLWLIADNVWSCVNLRLRAAAAGIGPERIIYAGRVGPADYMARLPLADLFLDTSPYNAGTIASDAIRMGLPLVTLSGESFASRMAGRLLAAIGADRGIATTLSGYVETAVTLASDPAAHAAYKALFTEARWAETIGDIAGFTAAYEPTLLRLQADLESGSDLDSGIDPQPVPNPVSGPNPEPVPAPTPDPDPQPVPDPVSGSNPEPVPAPTPGPDPEPARDLQLRSHALAA
jgi:predicted O-linked N-acetylglucosamine transferase (SPINDLY family)